MPALAGYPMSEAAGLTELVAGGQRFFGTPVPKKWA
jgi:hypothetical protein